MKIPLALLFIFGASCLLYFKGIIDSGSTSEIRTIKLDDDIVDLDNVVTMLSSVNNSNSASLRNIAPGSQPTLDVDGDSNILSEVNIGPDLDVPAHENANIAFLAPSHFSDVVSIGEPMPLGYLDQAKYYQDENQVIGTPLDINNPITHAFDEPKSIGSYMDVDFPNISEESEVPVNIGKFKPVGACINGQYKTC